MMKNKMKHGSVSETSLHLVSISLLGLALSFHSLANANPQEVEMQPLAELPNSISGNETVRDRMQSFINKDKDLDRIRRTQKDETGRSIQLFTATGTIAAPPNDPDFISARIIAFEKAMLDAKLQCAAFQREVLRNEAMLDITRPSQDRVKADADRMRREGLLQEGATKAAAALNSDISSGRNVPQIIKTAALYGEKIIGEKMSAGLRKLGLDPTKPVDQQAAKSVIEQTDFRNAVSTVAAARCTGLKAVAAFEQNPSNGRGSVGIVTVWSEKLHAIADAIVTNNWSLVPKKEPGYSLNDHIPSDKRTLLTTYGVQLVRDENGDLVILAFAQDQPRNNNQQSIDIAYRAADVRARGIITAFIGELVATNSELLGSEVSTDFSDASSRYQNNDSFNQFIKTSSEKLPISGVSRLREWETIHPANNGPVVGVVLQWSVASSQLASSMMKLNQETRSRTEATPPQSSSTGTNPLTTDRAAEPRKAESFSGQGRPSREF